MAWTEIPGGWERGRPYLTLDCRHQNDSCIEVGSDESSLDVVLIVRDEVTRTVSTNHIFSNEKTESLEKKKKERKTTTTCTQMQVLGEWGEGVEGGGGGGAQCGSRLE